MDKLEIKPTQKPVENSYAALCQFDDLGVSHEGPVKSALTSVLGHFYLAIPQVALHSLSAANGERAGVRCRFDISNFSQKQQFLNTVYEKFFQGFCVNVADTHDADLKL